MSLGAKEAMSRMLVVGARGFLGTFLADRASSRYQVLRGNRSREGDETDVVIDVTDAASVTRAFAESRPNVVVLLSAISDIDRCESNRQLAEDVNLHGAERVANACERTGARLLFTSTGAVFDGLKHGYSEEDKVSPVSVYGETKARAEAVIKALAPGAIIARVSLVLGRTGKPGTNSLVDNMIRRWAAQETLSSSVLESRNPIDAGTLSQWFVELLSDDRCSGIIHAGSTDSMTRYQLATAIADRLGVDPELVKEELQPAPGRAPRGLDHLLLTEKISRICTTQPPSCNQVIERSLNGVAEGSLRTGV